MMAPEDIDATAANDVGVLFAPGDSTEVEATFPDDKDDFDNGLGGSRPEAGPGDGLGGAGNLDMKGGARWVCLGALAAAVWL